MTNPSKPDAAARRVVAAARSILTYQIGLPAGCQRLRRALVWLAPYETGLPTVLEEYMSAVQALPLGPERLLWDRSAIQEKDVALEATN